MVRGSMRKRSFVKAAEPASAGLLLGYARVSRGDEQNNALQAKALRGAGCRRLFEEAASGGRWDRPELHRMLDQLRVGDTVVVWKLDRLSRSLKDVLHIMDRIADAGAGFRSVTENIDTTTHVCSTGRQPNANPRRQNNHRRRTVITRRSVTKPTSCPTLIDVPSGSVISILPSGACSVPLADGGSKCPAPSPFAGSLIVCTWQENRRRFRPEHAATYLAAPVP